MLGIFVFVHLLSKSPVQGQLWKDSCAVCFVSDLKVKHMLRCFDGSKPNLLNYIIHNRSPNHNCKLAMYYCSVVVAVIYLYFVQEHV